MIDDGLDLVFLFISDQVRWWTREVGSVGSGLLIGQEKRGVKYVVDAPGQREGKSIGHWRYYLVDEEGSLAPGGQLWGMIR